MATTTNDNHCLEEEDEDEKLPNLKYGYCETPLVWSEIQQIVLMEQNYDRLTRSISQQLEYERNKRIIQKEWKSMYDYVLCMKFSIPFDIQNNLKQARREEGDHTKYPRKVLSKNDFPYCFEDSVQHWILWKLEDSCTDYDIETAKEELHSLVQSPIRDMLHWINPPRLQSLPGIDHVHILVLLQNLNQPS